MVSQILNGDEERRRAGKNRNEANYKRKEEVHMSTMKSLSNMVFIAVAAVVAFILVLIFYSIVTTQEVSTAFFWTGIAALIVALVFYFAHASTGRVAILAVSGGFCLVGFVSLYASIASAGGDFGGKVLPLIILSIFVVIILLLIGSMASASAKDKAREARRKKY